MSAKNMASSEASSLKVVVFSNPNCATDFDTEGSELYGPLCLRAFRIFSISAFGWERFSHGT